MSYFMYHHRNFCLLNRYYTEQHTFSLILSLYLPSLFTLTLPIYRFPTLTYFWLVLKCNYNITFVNMKKNYRYNTKK